MSDHRNHIRDGTGALAETQHAISSVADGEKTVWRVESLISLVLRNADGRRWGIRGIGIYRRAADLGSLATGSQTNDVDDSWRLSYHRGGGQGDIGRGAVRGNDEAFGDARQSHVSD